MFIVILFYPTQESERTIPDMIWNESCYGIICLDREEPMEDKAWNYYSWTCSKTLEYRQHFSFNLQTKENNDWYGWSGGCSI